MLRRRKPLARGTGPARREAFERWKPLARQSPKKRAAAANWRRCRTIVWERSGGRCELCGAQLDRTNWECHHRRFRSQGGLDQPENLVALNKRCHRQAHGERRSTFESLGFVVPSHEDPAATPVVVFGRGTVFLDGSWYRRAAA